MQKKNYKNTLIKEVLSTSWKGAGSMWHLLKSTGAFNWSSSQANCWKKKTKHTKIQWKYLVSMTAK